MAEYIEKEKAALILREEAAAHYPTPYHVGLLAAARAIDSIPAADVRPVVRCGECEYRKDARVNEKGFLTCPASGMEITDHDYCSYGSRMDGDEE